MLLFKKDVLHSMIMFVSFTHLLATFTYGQLRGKMRKIAIIFLSISLNMCFGCSKEPSDWDGSFEYPQHMFWLRNKKNNFQLRTLIWGPILSLARTYANSLDPDQDRYRSWKKLFKTQISIQKKLAYDNKSLNRFPGCKELYRNIPWPSPWNPCLKKADFSSADIICKPLGPGPDQTKCRACSWPNCWSLWLLP